MFYVQQTCDLGSHEFVKTFCLSSQTFHLTIDFDLSRVHLYYLMRRVFLLKIYEDMLRIQMDMEYRLTKGHARRGRQFKHLTKLLPLS